MDDNDIFERMPILNSKMRELGEELKKTRRTIRKMRLGKDKSIKAYKKPLEDFIAMYGEDPVTLYEQERQELEETAERRISMYQEDCTTAIRNLRSDMLKEIEDAQRVVELELNCAEISKINYVNHDQNGKKTLRGRGGGELIVPPSYLNANPKPSTPSITQTAQFLLTEAEIAADLRAITKTIESSQAARGRRFDVQLSKQRLIYDSKPYKQTEEVTIENSTYGKFQARIDQINENVVIFKATASWDIRQIHASSADLQEGRVLLYKKRSN